MSKRILYSLVFLSFLSMTGFSQGKKVAVVNGETITEDQLKQAAAEDLQSLDNKHAQAQVEYQRDQQTILENTLSQMVDKRIIEAEAKKRGVTPQALMASEIESKVAMPTDAEVKSFYEANKARINIPPDQALGQVQQYLRQRNYDAAYDTFVGKLRKDYGVQVSLEPLRTQVASQGFPTLGPANAPVTIVIFSDFECPFCNALFPTMKQIEANYGAKIKVVYRQFPLTNLHPHAQKAAEASLCANDQQKFWEMHDAMFQDNQHLDIDALKQKATNLKLDRTAFDACLDSSKYAASVSKDVQEGVRVGVTGTPAMFINGRFLGGSQPYAEIAKVIDEELQKKN